MDVIPQAEQTDFLLGFLQSEAGHRDRIGAQRIYIDMNDGMLADGILFSQIVYWNLPGKNGKTRLKVFKDGYHWIAKEYSDWWEDCRVDTRTARDALARIEARGLIIKTTFKFNNKLTVHIRINWAVFGELLKLYAGLSPSQRKTEAKRRKTSRINDGKRQAKTTENVKKADGKRQEPMTENVNPITDTTYTDTTTENTSLSHPPAAGAAVAPAPEVAAKAVAPEAKRESVEAVEDRYHKFTSYFEEIEPGTYITHAYSLDDTMERCACGKPIEGLLTLPDIPAQHDLHSCRRCLGIVEANRAALTLPDKPLTPGKVLAAAAKKPPKSDLPPASKEVKDMLALACYGTVTAWNYDQNAKAMMKAYKDCKAPTVDQLKAHQRWWNVNDFRGRKGQRPKPHQVAETWAEFLGSQEGSTNGNTNASSVQTNGFRVPKGFGGRKD